MVHLDFIHMLYGSKWATLFRFKSLTWKSNKAKRLQANTVLSSLLHLVSSSFFLSFFFVSHICCAACASFLLHSNEVHHVLLIGSCPTSFMWRLACEWHLWQLETQDVDIFICPQIWIRSWKHSFGHLGKTNFKKSSFHIFFCYITTNLHVFYWTFMWRLNNA